MTALDVVSRDPDRLRIDVTIAVSCAAQAVEITERLRLLGGVAPDDGSDRTTDGTVTPRGGQLPC